MSSHMTEPVTSNGAATRQVMAVISDDYLAPASLMPCPTASAG